MNDLTNHKKYFAYTRSPLCKKKGHKVYITMSLCVDQNMHIFIKRNYQRLKYSNLTFHNINGRMYRLCNELKTAASNYLRSENLLI